MPAETSTNNPLVRQERHRRVDGIGGANAASSTFRRNILLPMRYLVINTPSLLYMHNEPNQIKLTTFVSGRRSVSLKLLMKAITSPSKF